MQNVTQIPKKSDKLEYIYRVDKFIVPETGQNEFLQAVKKTHSLLRTLPGFKQDFILEQVLGPGLYNFVTIVEWANNKYVTEAMQSVKLMQEQENFNPQEIMKRLNIQGDFSFSKNVIF